MIISKKPGGTMFTRTLALCALAVSFAASAPLTGLRRAFASNSFAYRMRSTVGLKSNPLAAESFPFVTAALVPMKVATLVSGLME